MMSPEIRTELERVDSPVHRKLLDFGVRRIRHSTQFWSQRHDRWQEAERLVRVFREPDVSDRRTRKQDLTFGVRKIVVPTCYSQVQSLLAWMMSVFAERSPVIPVEGVAGEDINAGILHELLLEHQFDQMMPHGVLVMMQWLMDSLTYGIGIVKNAWTIREFPTLQRVGDQIIEQDEVVYEGNESLNIAPQDFYPDPRRPYGDFHRGEYVFHRMRRSFSEVEAKENQGLYAGLDHITRMDQGTDKTSIGTNESGSELARTMEMGDFDTSTADEFDRPYLRLDEMWCLIRPEEMEIPSNSIGKGPRLWVITIANERRVLRAEPANLPAHRYPFEIIEVNHNVHAPANPGIVEYIKDLQYHQSWLFNSRMANVRKTLNNETLIDPSVVEETDLAEPSASGFIRLKKEFWQSGAELRNVAMPFPVQDVTTGHMGDSRVVQEMIESMTGGNRIAQGLANTGRRSATETQSQISFASGRLRLYALVASLQGLRGWAHQMVRNQQVFLEGRQGVKVRAPYDKILGAQTFVIHAELLQGKFRYPFLESGMPNDKLFEANLWREILSLGMQSGVATTAVQQINFLEVFARLLTTMGVKNVGNFFLPGPFPMDAIRAQAQAQATQQQSDEQVSRGVEAGNVIPADGFPRPTPSSVPGQNANGQGGANAVPRFN